MQGSVVPRPGPDSLCKLVGEQFGVLSLLGPVVRKERYTPTKLAGDDGQEAVAKMERTNRGSSQILGLWILSKKEAGGRDGRERARRRGTRGT